MGKYIGQDKPYGIFETQSLTEFLNDSTREFTLNYTVADTPSILVVAGGAILQPNEEYTIADGGTKLVLEDALPAGLPLFVYYLGRPLAVPTVLEKQPILYKEIADGVKTEFQPTTKTLVSSGIIVFKNGVQQKYHQLAADGVTVLFAGDFFINAENKVEFLSTPANGDMLDFHILGVERNDISSVTDGAITTAKLQDRSVTPNKLNLFFTPYSLTASTFGGMVAGVTVQEAEYADMYVTTKIRVKFTVTLSGVADNKVRISLPKPNNGSTIIDGTVTVSSNSSVETGIARWGSTTEFDIYRQFAVNYALDTYTIEAVLEYKNA